MDIDVSKPHIGRIYDCVLGGHHNYEADRQAVAHILKAFPSYPRWARLNRWFLQLVAQQWAEQGRQRVLDIASGLPTQGHLNDFLPDARILYSDNDPISVAYGEEMLKDRPNMRYAPADATRPQTLIDEATAFFADERQVAIGCIGIAYFLDDEQLAALARALYDWSAPGSALAVTICAPFETVDEQKRDGLIAEMGRLTGTRIFIRSAARLAELAAPWRMTRADPLQTWLEVPDLFSEEEIRAMGGYMLGALLER